jgi:hypothetical protein
MNYKKLLKSELLELVFKLENENKEVVFEFQKEMEEKTLEELDLKSRLREYMKLHDDLSWQIVELNTLFSMLVLSLGKLQETYEDQVLTKLQENIILVSESFRDRIIGEV